jgi:thiamine-monophosphate kinase
MAQMASPPMGEFELIARYFTRPCGQRALVRAGIGDDCALLDIGDATWAITSDMLLAGRHFFSDDDAEAIGHKALAVNLSDLAAAGATPRCFLLALALPAADEPWLAAFARGLFGVADAFGCDLIGGDTTRAPTTLAAGGESSAGPLTICITALGDVPRALARRRSGAQVGDDLWLSGEVGDAALALARRVGTVDGLAAADAESINLRLQRPTPRVALGLALRGVAGAAIDISDGLGADLAHLLRRSGVAARVRWEDIPRSPVLRRQTLPIQQRCALAGGDDYELLFAAPRGRQADVTSAARTAGVAVTRIGAITQGEGLTVLDADGRPVETSLRGFDHFAP